MPGPILPVFLQKTFARQLGKPSGPLGSLVARMLNKGNAGPNRAAVDALDLIGGETVADLGFGGGVGLDLLLDAVGPSGRVHGVDPSSDMVARARRGHRDALADGRLRLHLGTLEALPFADGALDGWLTLNTIYFLDDLAAAGAELARVLSPDGHGVVGIGDPEAMARLRFTKHGFRLRQVAEVVKVLTGAGLSVDRQQLSRGDGPSFNLLVCRLSLSPPGTRT